MFRSVLLTVLAVLVYSSAQAQSPSPQSASYPSKLLVVPGQGVIANGEFMPGVQLTSKPGGGGKPGAGEDICAKCGCCTMIRARFEEVASNPGGLSVRARSEEIQQVKPLEVRSAVSGVVIPQARFDEKQFAQQRSGLAPAQPLRAWTGEASVYEVDVKKLRETMRVQ